MAFQITLIPGNGIGAKITKAAVKINDFTGLRIDRQVVEADMTAINKYRNLLPREVLEHAIEKGEKVTKDINPGKYVNTTDFAQAIIEEPSLS